MHGPDVPPADQLENGVDHRILQAHRHVNAKLRGHSDVVCLAYQSHRPFDAERLRVDSGDEVELLVAGDGDDQVRIGEVFLLEHPFVGYIRIDDQCPRKVL